MVVDLALGLLGCGTTAGLAVVLIGIRKRSAARVGYGALVLCAQGLLLYLVFHEGLGAIMLAGKVGLGVMVFALAAVANVLRGPWETLWAAAGPVAFASALFLLANAP